MAIRHHQDAKIARLKEVELFRDADKKALAHLASAADEVQFAAGATMMSQGHRHSEGYVILTGTASVTVNGEHVADIPNSYIVGELGLFGHSPASATVIAKTDLEALSIPYNRFDQILEDNPAMTKAIAQQLAGRLHAMNQAR
ncbi:MAG: cyclic nucleotide-binding domain-containing protein [Acidimicrobiales bacterium]